MNEKKKAERWAVIRVPRWLYEKIRDGQGTTLHETITRAMNASEDPKAARRLREVRAELAKLQKLYDGALELVDELRKELAKQPPPQSVFPAASRLTAAGFRAPSILNGSPAKAPIFGKGIKRWEPK